MKKLFLILTLFITATVLAQSINTQKLDSLFSILDTNKKAMGSVAISKNGQLLYTKSIGFIDAGKTIKANAQTQYRIGSITKMLQQFAFFN